MKQKYKKVGYKLLLKILIGKILKLTAVKIKKKYYVRLDDIFFMLEDFSKKWLK